MNPMARGFKLQLLARGANTLPLSHLTSVDDLAEKSLMVILLINTLQKSLTKSFTERYCKSEQERGKLRQEGGRIEIETEKVDCRMCVHIDRLTKKG